MDFLITILLLGAVCWWVVKMMGRPSGGAALGAFLAQNNAKLEYRYENLLGIDTHSDRVFVQSDRAWLLDKAEIRQVEKSSILETRVGGYGHQFHKDKHCKLIIHTRSLDKPTHEVRFGSRKREMDEWHARLAVFCGLN